jgi:hypothetical protein
MKGEYEDVVFEPDDMFRVCVARERQGENNNHRALAFIAHGSNFICIEYSKVHNGITIIVELSGNITTEVRFYVSQQKHSSHRLAG